MSLIDQAQREEPQVSDPEADSQPATGDAQPASPPASRSRSRRRPRRPATEAGPVASAPSGDQETPPDAAGASATAAVEDRALPEAERPADEPTPVIQPEAGAIPEAEGPTAEGQAEIAQGGRARSSVPPPGAARSSIVAPPPDAQQRRRISAAIPDLPRRTSQPSVHTEHAAAAIPVEPAPQVPSAVEPVAVAPVAAGTGQDTVPEAVETLEADVAASTVPGARERETPPVGAQRVRAARPDARAPGRAPARGFSPAQADRVDSGREPREDESRAPYRPAPPREQVQERPAVGFIPPDEALSPQPPVSGGDAAIFHVGRSTQLRQDNDISAPRSRRRGHERGPTRVRETREPATTHRDQAAEPLALSAAAQPPAEHAPRAAAASVEAEPTGDLALLLRGMDEIQSRHTDRLMSALRQAPPPASAATQGVERVGIFVDVANLLYAARYLNRWIDFARLLDRLVAGRRLVRAQAYSPTDPDPSAEQSFFAPVKGQGYRVTTKAYRTFSSGAKKADMDLDIAMDIVRLVDAGAVDSVVLASGDGDFLPVLEYCSDHGVRVEVAAFSESTHDELRKVCDRFINLSIMDGAPARR